MIFNTLFLVALRVAKFYFNHPQHNGFRALIPMEPHHVSFGFVKNDSSRATVLNGQIWSKIK